MKLITYWLKGGIIIGCITLIFSALVFTISRVSVGAIHQGWFLFSWVGSVTLIYAAPLTIYLLRKDGHISLMRVGLLGAFLGFLVTYFLLRLPLQGWEQLPTPPTPLTKLIAANSPSHWDAQLYAQSADGQVWLYRCAPECEWSPVNAVSQEDLDDFFRLTLMQPYRRVLKPLPPRHVVDSMNTKIVRIESVVDAYFILTDDGIVWYWESTSSLYDSVLFLLTTIVGGALSLAIGLGRMTLKFLP